MKPTSAYLSNQFGYSETGKYLLDNVIKPRITKLGIQINDPFLECEKELDFRRLQELTAYKDHKEFWMEFGDKVTPINNKLMQSSDCMLAILDGGHAIDDGVASEIGYYYGIRRGPIFALRSDVRCGENMAVTINLQVLGYIKLSGGILAEGNSALEKWISAIKGWHDSFRRSRK